MNAKGLQKLRQKLAEMRRSPQKARDIQALAKKLGRKSVKRGKEPTWESQIFVNLNPLSIPNHGGKDIPNGTKNSILHQLEDDLNSWEEKLAEEDN